MLVTSTPRKQEATSRVTNISYTFLQKRFPHKRRILLRIWEKVCASCPSRRHTTVDMRKGAAIRRRQWDPKRQVRSWGRENLTRIRGGKRNHKKVRHQWLLNACGLRYTESSEHDGKEHCITSSTPSTMTSPSCSSSNKDEDDLELRRLLSPTPTPSSSSSAAAYLYNNPYRRRYLGYQHHTPLLLSPHSPSKSSTLPPLSSRASSAMSSTSSCLKYPARSWDKKVIYDRMLHSAKIGTLPPTRKFGTGLTSSTTSSYSDASPKPVTVVTRTTPTITPTTSSSSSSNVQVEVLLPLGKLINQVLTDFVDDSKTEKTKSSAETPTSGKMENTSTNSTTSQGSSHINNLFTFKSSVSSNTTTPLCKSEVEVDVHFTATGRPQQGSLFFPKGGNSASNINKSSKGGSSSSININSCNSGVERISFIKPPVLGLGECRESEIM